VDFILTFVVLLLMQALLFAPHTENLSYRDFKALLKAGKVEALSGGADDHRAPVVGDCLHTIWCAGR
jgi:hypothetical protein